jgi:arsenite-transporting ATPase
MRFVFFGGKGGVGKTTCAAAAALRAAREGERVLVVSTDPAHSLGDALDLELGAEPRRVKDVPGAGELWAAELDADKALKRWLRAKEEAIRTIADRGTYLDEEDVDRFMSLSFPGVDELVGLVELQRLARQRDYDQVVVDTAPTGHTLRLLEMPDTLQRLGEVLDQMHEKHRFLASSLGGAWRGDFADEVIDEIEGEARELHELLKDPKRVAFTWVTLPEELPVLEAERGVEELEARGLNVDVIVVNRVWPVPDRACPLCSPRVEYERGWREKIQASFVGKTILEAPARIAEPREVSELLSLAASVQPIDITELRVPLVSKRAPRLDLEEMATIATGTTALSPIADTVRLALFGGKGGVGKTTVAAASALELASARPKDRVLILSTDPAHSLGDALAMEIGDATRKVPKAPPNLRARELDAVKAWDAERERYRQGVEDLFASIFTGNMTATYDRAVLEDLLDLAPPGIDELLAIVTILDALVGEKPTYDLVVVDTAPTGHTLRLLALPEKALEWVHALMSVILKYRSVVGLGEFAQDLTLLAKRLRGLIALLSDPVQCAFIVVTRPAALPRLETERLARDLRHLKVPVAAIVANAVTNPTCSRCIVAANEERGELEKLERLASRAARSPRLIVTPAVYPGPHGVRELRLFRDEWTERGMLRGV